MNKATKSQIAQAVAMAANWRVECMKAAAEGDAAKEEQFRTWGIADEGKADTAVRCAGLSRARQDAMLWAVFYASRGEFHASRVHEMERDLSAASMFHDLQDKRIQRITEGRRECLRHDLLEQFDRISEQTYHAIRAI